ncbi:MAG: hypothetical protein QOC73_136 [Actinomycetota bacterium]|nr:hypothetical protein [Actinomycetota bacterium]
MGAFMAVDLFLPSAVVHALVSDGGAMLGGPPRAVEHITWDAARPDGSLPDFAGLLSFFTGSGKGSAPHLLADPCSGDRVQFFPANVASRALVHDAGTNPGTGQTNRFGSVCLQTEWRFSPHGRCPVHGVVHTTLFDTPMLGLAEIRAWQAEFGIPQVWAMGAPPTWKSNRSPDVWTSTAGYYSHSQVPWQAPTNHSDPGPMPLLVGEAPPVTVSGPPPATISSPDPQPIPHPVAEVDVTVILMNSEGPDQWISDGLRRRHIADVASLQAWQKILKTVVVTPQELASIVDITPTGAAATVISLADAAKVP